MRRGRGGRVAGRRRPAKTLTGFLRERAYLAGWVPGSTGDFHAGHHFHRRDGRARGRHLGRRRAVPRAEGAVVNVLYVVGGVIAVLHVVYLFVALFRAEDF